MLLRRMFRELLLLFIGLVFLIPFWMVFINSFKERKDANLFGIGLPPGLNFHFENYVKVYLEGGILRGFINGLIEASFSVLILIFISSIAGFIISRNKGKTSKVLYYLFLSGLIIPPAFISTFLVLKATHLLNTYTGIILIFTAYGLPFNIFMYNGFVKGIPREIDESAIMEGSGSIRMFYSFIFPLLKPISVTCFIFNFVGAWNDVMIPLFFASGDKWALPLTVYKFYGTYSKDWNLVFADIIITIAPLMVIYIFLQRFIIEGMTAGAVKA